MTMAELKTASDKARAEAQASGYVPGTVPTPEQRAAIWAGVRALKAWQDADTADYLSRCGTYSGS